ncbi:MAG TPA: hypothetical protein VEF36_17925 [Roseiarcus sp.]|nr:hypothetical protein [Roseiarcus sp.]
MSSKEIKDRYGAFAEAARREPVVHTSHGRPTLVTISIDRARSLPGLREELAAPADAERQKRLARLLEMGGVGVGLVGEQTPAQLAERGRAFRGDD